MGKKIEQVEQVDQTHKNTKANRFQKFSEPHEDNKQTWPTDAVVYVGHLPHGFLQDQLKSYFAQYGDVLGVKVARSKKTARSKGYAFIQFRYPEVAQIVSQTMNGYLLLGKVLVSQTLPANKRNPFSYATSAEYKYINWKRMYIQQKNAEKTEEQTAHIIHSLLKNQEKRREKFRELSIEYDYPGFSSFIPRVQKPIKMSKQSKVKQDKSQNKSK